MLGKRGGGILQPLESMINVRPKDNVLERETKEDLTILMGRVPIV